MIPQGFLEIVGCLDVLQLIRTYFSQLEVAFEVGLTGDGGLEVLDGCRFVIDGKADLSQDIEDLVVIGIDLDGVLRHFEAALIFSHEITTLSASY